MKKFLVTADTYAGTYGVEYTLFGIFDTKEEAVKWIIEHPVVVLQEADEEYDIPEETFDFFSGYEEGKGMLRRGRRGHSDTYVPMSKEEYITKFCSYIIPFDGTPKFIGGYRE